MVTELFAKTFERVNNWLKCRQNLNHTNGQNGEFEIIY